MREDYKWHRKIGFGRYRSLVLTLWMTPVGNWLNDRLL